MYAFVDLFGACLSVRIENMTESNIQTPISETKQQKCFRIPSTTLSCQPEGMYFLKFSGNILVTVLFKFR